MANRIILPPKRQSELVLYSQFDFLSLFASANDFITATPTVSVSVYSGIDPNPSAIISSITFFTSMARVFIQGGILGVIYDIKVQASLNSGQNPVLCGYLAIIPDLP